MRSLSTWSGERRSSVGGRGGSSSAITKERMLEDLNALMREQGRLGPEQQVQRAYKELAQRPGDWVGLAQLRQRLTGLSREEQDRALRSLISHPRVSIVPEVDQTLLSDRDRAAAIRIGGELKHAISID